MTEDPMDRPEEHGWGLVVPFVACRSQGGEYDDDAFAAGFACGQIDQALQAAGAVRATTVQFDPVRTALVKQLELLAMNRGFPTVTVETSQEWPEWSAVTFAAAGTPGGDHAVG